MLWRSGSHSPLACIRLVSSAALRMLRRRSDCSLCSASVPPPAARWRLRRSADAAAAATSPPVPRAATIFLSSRLLTTILTRTAPPTSSRDRTRPPWCRCSSASAAALDWCRPATASLGKKHLVAIDLAATRCDRWPPPPPPASKRAPVRCLSAGGQAVVALSPCSSDVPCKPQQKG
ncbi:hypothetical protein VPH35_105360 [Triticum aestivum]